VDLLRTCTAFDQLNRFAVDSVVGLRFVVIGINAAGDASPAIFGQPGTKCLISPPKFVKIVIKLPAERCNQYLWYKQDTQTFKEKVIILILHELRRHQLHVRF